MLILKLATIAAVAVALMALIAALAQIPFDAVAGSVLIAEIAAAATLAAVAIVRRAGRQRWTPEPPRTQRDQLPVPRVDAEVVESQTTKEIDYDARNVPRISSQAVHLLAAPTDHRDR